jgi:hydrogenase/urease accessory protein HupE
MRVNLTTALIAVLALASLPGVAQAHPVVEHALDVLIGKNRIVITARISQEEILVVDGKGATQLAPDKLRELSLKHAAYVPRHLRVRVDGVDVPPESAKLLDHNANGVAASSLVPYRVEYALKVAPHVVQLDQSFLREIPLWSASCVVRIRQENQPDWEIALLTAQQTAEYECDWAGPTTKPAVTAKDQVALGPTIRAYVVHGIMHILTGYDHMLFITALVLATTRLWDLIKVVTAFTLAHTITLALSVFNVVTVSERIVEPMIALSIIFVAVQNIFWPERSRGWTRLAVAFGFGLFHGLGFAGGLKEAMAGMPGVELWAALIAFSLGVEIAHQMVIIPSYAAMTVARDWRSSEQPRVRLAAYTRQFGSAGISLAGLYFLVQAITM